MKVKVKEMVTVEQLANMIDHTNLKAFADDAAFEKLCDEAKKYNFKMVAINPAQTVRCKKKLEGSPVHVGAAIGFPLGQTTLECKIFETKDAIEKGADEIDYVINVAELKNKNYDYIKKEMEEIVKICREAGKTSKVIFENCYLTDDENADSVIIRTTPDQEGWYINRFTIYLNGKRTTEISLRDHDCYYLTVKYAKMSTQHTFIQIIGRGENDYVTYNEIFTYNKKSNQFRVVKSFNDRSSYAEEIVTANKKGITVKHRVQPMETGWINWTLPFKYSKQKFIRTASSTKTVRSELGQNRKDKYSRYFAKNKFITAKKVTFYKKAGSKKVAFRVPKGKAVTLKKLIYSKKKIYLQFKYGKKHGYLRVNRANYNFEKPLFQNVNSRLSG